MNLAMHPPSNDTALVNDLRLVVASTVSHLLAIEAALPEQDMKAVASYLIHQTSFPHVQQFLASATWCLCRHEQNRRALLSKDDWVGLLQGWISSGLKSLRRHHGIVHGAGSFYTNPLTAGGGGGGKQAGSTAGDEDAASVAPSLRSRAAPSQFGAHTERPKTAAPSVYGAQSERPKTAAPSQFGSPSEKPRTGAPSVADSRLGKGSEAGSHVADGAHGGHGKSAEQQQEEDHTTYYETHDPMLQLDPANSPLNSLGLFNSQQMPEGVSNSVKSLGDAAALAARQVGAGPEGSSVTGPWRGAFAEGWYTYPLLANKNAPT